jgi:hypothetical protein
MTETSNPQIAVVNCETGEEMMREANAEELAQMQADKTARDAYEAGKKQQAEEKAALLARLGLTEDELKTILG